MSKILGIDLGTTNSCAAIMEGGEPSVICNQEGTRTTPSVVAFNKGDILVGQVAKRQAVNNPANTIYSIKRFMGRNFDEVSTEISEVPYEVIKRSSSTVAVRAGGKEYTPPEISAMILQKLKKSAEDFIGETITEAVITVPAYFNDAQRKATQDAGKIAGLDVKRIINEPTAAALAYGLDKKGESNIAVFDFGGGTFDISILEIGGGVFEVKATNGDTHLGGDDFDQYIIDWILEEFKRTEGIDLAKDAMALQRLKDAAEDAKKELSSSQETEINLPFITADANGPKHLKLTLTRAKFEQLVEELIERVVYPCKTALKDSGIEVKDINEVVLVGGSTRIPAIQAKVKELFGKDPHQGVNPDEVVAIGAAIQAGVISGDVKDILLIDVTPLSLGIETLGGICTKLIEKNTTIPVRKSNLFSTAADNQPTVEIHVLQGERGMASDNRTIGKFHLDGIPPAPRGMPQIEVSFDIDTNGVLNVTAKDMATNKEQSVRIEFAGGLDDSEVEKMIKDAESHSEEDKIKKTEIEIRNHTEQVIYKAEQDWEKNKDKLQDSEKSEIESSLQSLKNAHQAGDIDEMKNGIEAVTTAWNKASDSIYKQAKTEDASSYSDVNTEDPIDPSEVFSEE